LHQGEFEGRKKRISPHLCRAPQEATDPELHGFYEQLLRILQRPAVRNGHWRLLECESAWDGNWTRDCFVAFAWESDAGDRFVVVVNYAANQSQCRVRLPFADLSGRQWRLADQLSDAVYDREGDDLQSHGMFIDAAPWQASVFEIESI
jgi:hypothetical protein